MRAEEYLQILSEHIRCKKARDAVKEEVCCHLKDQEEAFKEEGMEKEAAEEAAVKEMGDPVEAGALLDRIHRPRMAWGMISLIVLLSIVGCLIQYFLSGRLVLWMLPGIFLSLSCPSLVTAWILFLSFAIVLAVCIYKNWFQVSRKKTLGILCGLLILLPVAGGFWLFS